MRRGNNPSFMKIGRRNGRTSLDPAQFAARCLAPEVPRELTPHHLVEGSAGHRARASSFDDVPEAKSPRSTRTTSNPRSAASRATPALVATTDDNKIDCFGAISLCPNCSSMTSGQFHFRQNFPHRHIVVRPEQAWRDVRDTKKCSDSHCVSAALRSRSKVTDGSQGGVAAMADHDFEWRMAGACRGLDPDIFYPEEHDDAEIAKEICDSCVVQVHPSNMRSPAEKK